MLLIYIEIVFTPSKIKNINANRLEKHFKIIILKVLLAVINPAF